MLADALPWAYGLPATWIRPSDTAAPIWPCIGVGSGLLSMALGFRAAAHWASPPLRLLTRELNAYIKLTQALTYVRTNRRRIPSPCCGQRRPGSRSHGPAC